MSARFSVDRGVKLTLDTLVTAAQRDLCVAGVLERLVRECHGSAAREINGRGPSRQVGYLAERLGEGRLMDSVALGLRRAPRGRR